MISRRYFLAAVGAAVAVSSGAVRAANEQSFTAQAFRAAQDAGKPILVDIQASWCPTCRAQTKILNELTALPQFKDLVVLRVDFDSHVAALHPLNGDGGGWTAAVRSLLLRAAQAAGYGCRNEQNLEVTASHRMERLSRLRGA